MEKKKYKILMGVFSALVLIATAVGMFLIRDGFKEPQVFRDFIGQHYLAGALILFLISSFQVIFALVPGELIEVASGFTYGAVWGTIICFLGIMAGSILLFYLVRRFGRPFAEKLFDMEKMDNLSFLQNKKKRNSLTFLLYLLPGTPKDLVTLFLGLTDMPLKTYLLLTSLTRLPSIVISTIGGNGFGSGKFMIGLYAMLISAGVSLIGFLIYHFISKYHKKKNEQ